MTFNTTLADIRLKREDLSDYLYHFTKNADAFDTLRTILGEGELKDVGKKGVICFTEAPFPMLINMFGIFSKYVNPLYAPYGIAIKKKVCSLTLVQDRLSTALQKKNACWIRLYNGDLNPMTRFIMI
jgi:hypothetical protein